jgi:hypothetical protein
MDSLSDFYKVYFWRTHSRQEVDFVVQIGQKIVPFEVTYSTLILPKKIRNLKAFLEDESKSTFAVYLYGTVSISRTFERTNLKNS